MPHVGDGEIHAYLDGALDLFPAAEAQRIRDHLRSCPDCGRRLDEEMSLREGAEAILAGAGPGVGDAPAFEEIRARASAVPPQKTQRARRLPPTLLPWAASIVLALAVGWGARGTALRSTGVPDVASRSALEGVGARADDAEPVSTDLLDAVAASVPDPIVGGSADVSTVGEVALDTDAKPEDAFRVADGRVGRDAGLVQDAAAPAPSSGRDEVGAVAKSTIEDAEERLFEEEVPTAPAESEAAAFADRVAPERDAEDRAEIQARRALAESQAPAQERLDQANEPVARQAAGEGGERRGRASALESSTVSVAGLMVPGLQVESIDVDPALGPAGSLRIVQRLPGGERLELLFVTAAQEAQERDGLGGPAFAVGDELALPAAPSGWSRIEVPRPGGWLIAQGAVPADSLAMLVEHLR